MKIDNFCRNFANILGYWKSSWTIAKTIFQFLWIKFKDLDLTFPILTKLLLIPSILLLFVFGVSLSFSSACLHRRDARLRLDWCYYRFYKLDCLPQKHLFRRKEHFAFFATYFANSIVQKHIFRLRIRRCSIWNFEIFSHIFHIFQCFEHNLLNESALQLTTLR